MNRRHLLAAALLLAAAMPATAHDFKAGPITIGHPWARPTAAGQPVGGGFMKFSNAGAADRLVAVSAGVSATVELHTMRMEGDVMRMRQVDAIELPAGGSVELKPGGLHLMFIGLKQPLKAGETFPATLRFEKAGEVVVQFKVETPTGAAPAPAHSHKH
jgi:copper(I)-binding protein